MKPKVLGAALLMSAATLLASAPASAALLSISGGSGIITPASNNVLGGGVAMLDNATIATTTGMVRLDFYYLGAESGATNTLVVGGTGGGSHAETGTSPTGETFWLTGGVFKFSTVVAAAGAVPMSFTSTIFGGSLLPGGGDAAKSIAFAYLTCTGALSCISATPTNMVLFALDDSGAGPDDNHDDYVGYMVASPVPLPAAVWLFGSGLLGLFGISRRRSAAA